MITKYYRKAAWFAAGAILIVTSIAACGVGDKNNEPFKDAGRTGNDSSPAMTVDMPDGFSNLATKCIEGTHVRVTVAYHGDSSYGSVSSILDPSCK